MLNSKDLIEHILNDISRTLRQVEEEEIEQFTTTTLSAKRIFIAGKGRTGLQMSAFAMRLMHLGLSVHVVNDVTTPAINENDLLIIGSGSGRTASLLSYAEYCKAHNIPIALITGNPNSTLAQSAHTVLNIPATNPKVSNYSADSSILVMGSLFEHCLGLMCDLIVIQLKDALNIPQDEMNQRHANLE